MLGTAKTVAILTFAFLTISNITSAQFSPSPINPNFGKNRVVWEPASEEFYQSTHFDVWHSLDISDPGQKFYLERTVRELERSYEWLSSTLDHQLKDRVPVVVFKTHSAFESSLVAGGNPFMPEGVGAYAEPSRNRMVLKLDFLPTLNNTIMTHELVHIFYFDMARGIFGLVNPLPLFFVEGVMANYLAAVHNPYGRDDIRGISQRAIASNPAMYLPTWEMMERGRCGPTQSCNPYVVGAMVSEFLADTFGEKAVLNFIINGSRLKKTSGQINGNTPLFNAVVEATEGKISNPKRFHELHMEYWSNRYAQDSLDKQKPFQETANFAGRSISPIQIPYPILSPAVSPDGNKISCLTVHENKIVAISFPIGEEGRKPDGEYSKSGGKISVLTKYSTPNPFEYIISQGLVTWPFNGSDLDWSKKSDKIVFFARKNRDHELVIVDSSTGNILDEIELDLDQAFSPAWGHDGKKIYFSASENITRDIYVIDLETRKVANITKDGSFDTAPAVSPDGTKLVYVSSVGNIQKLFILDLATENKEQLTFGNFNDSSPSFSSDGKRVAYTSDEQSGGVWNLYTLDLETKTVSQWTDLFGGAFTPKFSPNKADTIYYVAYWQYDQYMGYIYPNFRLYEAILKDPIRQYTTESRSGSSDLPEEKPLIQLDPNQLSNPLERPARWRFSLVSAQLAYGGGSFASLFFTGSVRLTDMLENRMHYFHYTSFGDKFRAANYSYTNRENRLNLGYSAYYHDFPVRSIFWDPDLFVIQHQQRIFNQTDSIRAGFDIFGSYPLNKFNRFEVGLGLRHRTFTNSYRATTDNLDDLEINFTDDDRQVLRVFEESSGNNASFSGSLVRDTVYYSLRAQGPYQGSALKIQGEIAPTIGNFSGYSTFRVHGRKYFGLTSSGNVVFAVRGDVISSSSKSGEVILLGGSQSLRGYNYGALIGNNIGYASAELRFPLVNGILFPGNVLIGPLRGIVFADVGYAKFRNEDFPIKKGSSIGGMIQFLPIAWSFSWTEMDGFKDRKTQILLAFNW